MTSRALRTVALVAALPAAALSAASPATAQDSARKSAATITTADSALEARTAAIAATLRCPVCQGESIQDSPAELAQQMRSLVRERLRAGETPEQIKAYFVSKYGEWILLEPKMTGLNIALYVLPVLVVVSGLALIAALVRRWTASTPTSE